MSARLELTTVSTDRAVFHEGTAVTVLDGLEPGSAYEHRDIAFRTLPRPAGRLRCRVATVNDVHFGEIEAGRMAGSDLGPVQRVAPGASPYPEVMNLAAVSELLKSESAGGPLAAVVVKGDLTTEGTRAEFDAFERCYRTAFGDRLFAVRGNHDAYRGQTDYAGDRWISLPGLAVALVDTVTPGHTGGRLAGEQLDWLDANVSAATDPVIVMGHHPQFLGAIDDNASFILSPDDSVALDELIRRHQSVIAYAAGHTHRHRVQHAADGVPSIEVGCVKDFPGTWAEYEVYDGGVLQIVHRISTPEALAWSERCRVLYADFGVDYTSYGLGRLDDRCFPIRLRS